MIETDKNLCPREDVAAYLDGELDSAALARFESHVAQCKSCAGELLRQRQLVCTLDAAFNSHADLDLPLEFSRVIAAHAESDVRGLLSRTERRRAAQLCAMLGLAAFALLGAASGALLFQPARRVLRLMARIFELFWQTTSDAAESLGIILRVLARGFTGSPYIWPALIGLTLIIAAAILSRLIGKYHRTQIIE